MVEDPRYTTKMMVVGFTFDTNRVQHCSRRNNVVCTCNGVDIYQHPSVQHAGIIYFKNKEDVIKAVEILGNRVKNLFD